LEAFVDVEAETKEAYKLTLTPLTIVIDNNGKVERIWPGVFSQETKREVEMGCTPFVRQKVKIHQHQVENSPCLRPIVLSQSAAVGEAEAGSAGEQPARNSQLETHRDDEPGAAVTAVAPTPRTLHRIDRFPYA